MNPESFPGEWDFREPGKNRQTQNEGGGATTRAGNETIGKAGWDR